MAVLVGRPPLSESEKDFIARKLEPYLKAGYSVRKALREAQIPNSTFYKLMSTDGEFMEQIHHYQQYLSVLLSRLFFEHLISIVSRQVKGEGLEKTDLEFLQWFAIHSVSTREEFDRNLPFSDFDPDAEFSQFRRYLGEN